MKQIATLLVTAVALAGLALAPEASAQTSAKEGRIQYRTAVNLYEHGFYDQARAMFESLPEIADDPMARGYALLCAEKLRADGYESMFERYTDIYPHSALIPQIRLQYAMNLFEDENYERACLMFASVGQRHVRREQKAEYMFKHAYSCYMTGRSDSATRIFIDLDELNSSDYSGPARYFLGVSAYEDKRFEDAVRWFSRARKDRRFAEMSAYYMLDSKFMLKDYRHVADKGPEMLGKVPSGCRAALAKIIAQSFLTLGDAESARRFYSEADAPRSRSDYFFAGSLMFAVHDWAAAIENYGAMDDRRDSLGQIASYNLGYSYIQTKNKVAAMRSFREASLADFNPELTEDAFFNYAKLAFDLNNDASAFSTYIERYPSKAANDRIYGYVAVAALRSRDYAAAVEAFDKIDELDENMRGNYMKTNYLRASELLGQGAWKGAVPCLKAAAYYSSKSDPFWQMSRYWLGESYFRSGDYSSARAVFMELYNMSALDGREEGAMIPFNIAWCHFKEGDYDQAIRWFDTYADSGDGAFRKNAFLRKADSWFMKKKYAVAVPIYERVASEYGNVNDIYPYYQAGICYGLSGDNSRKIAALSPVRNASADSRFYSEALYELGRAYLASGRSTDAKDCFESLLSDAKDSTYMAKSLIDLGMIFRNARKYDAALGYYKQVVEKMPSTEYSDDALAAIESIYQTMADPQAYLDYLAEIGRSGLKTDAEREMMIFNAAEQVYLSEDYEKAIASLGRYLEDYPSASMSDRALFYMADSYRKLGQKETACDTYAKVVSRGSGAYQEMALVHYASLAYGLQRYDEAYRAYGRLVDVSQFDDNRFLGLKGKMDSAFRGRDFDNALAAAAAVKEDGRCEGDLLRHADWVMAKSYLATSRRDEAFDLLVLLAVHPRTAEGAEAVYLLIQDCYDRGDFARVEELVYSFSDSGTGQEYWLARSFIVLGDSFVERDDSRQAAATYQSILDGYTPQGADDDIIDNVKLRISRMQK